MSKKSFSILILIAANAFAVDVVKMQNGDVYRGEIIKLEFKKKIQILFKDGNEKSLPWSEIAAIEKEAPSAQPQNSPTSTSVILPIQPVVKADSNLNTTQPIVEQQKDSISSFKPKWHAYFKPGLTVANSSSYTLKSGSTSLGGTSDSGKASVFIGTEVLYQPHPIFGASILIDWNKYNYKSGFEADTHLGIFVMPRVQTIASDATLWFGLGMGLQFTSLGVFSVTNGNFIITVDQSVTSLALSPRIGADFNLSKSKTLGVEIFYTFGGGNISGTILNRATVATADFSEDVSRKWLGIVAKLGFDL